MKDLLSDMDYELDKVLTMLECSLCEKEISRKNFYTKEAIKIIETIRESVNGGR